LERAPTIIEPFTEVSAAIAIITEMSFSPAGPQVRFIRSAATASDRVMPS